jgi:hypothetical protein
MVCTYIHSNDEDKSEEEEEEEEEEKEEGVGSYSVVDVINGIILHSITSKHISERTLAANL